MLPIVSQMDIFAKRGAIETEIDNLLALDGFSPIRTIDSCRKWDYLNNEMGVEVNDLHDENVLVRTNGEIAVMDPIPMMEETSKLRRLSEIG